MPPEGHAEILDVDLLLIGEALLAEIAIRGLPRFVVEALDRERAFPPEKPRLRGARRRCGRKAEPAPDQVAGTAPFAVAREGCVTPFPASPAN